MNFQNSWPFLNGRLLCFALCIAPIATLANDAATAVAINDPYIRAVPPVVTTTAAFMQVQNGGKTPYSLVSASTPVAGKVELHTHEHDNGVMRMRKVERILLPPAETVTLEPGGLHVMLFQLKSRLAPGDQVPLTLTFDDGSMKNVNAAVRHVESMMHH